MCDFISWIEYKKEILFLTKYELETARGKALRKHLGPQFENDVKGHGAIEWYYKLKPYAGRHRECTDFSSPDNFPKPIVSAIKKGHFCYIGIAEGLLTKKAEAEYQKVTGQAWAEYQKVTGPAEAEYQKVTGPAWAEYQKVKGPAEAEYQKVTWQAEAEYQKVKGPAAAEYQKVTWQAFWKISKVKTNRVKAWR